MPLPQLIFSGHRLSFTASNGAVDAQLGDLLCIIAKLA
jgi:hypothetical protein